MNRTSRIRETVRRVQAEADRISPQLPGGVRTTKLIHSGIETFYASPLFMYMALRPAGGDEAAQVEWPLTGRLFEAGNRHSAVLDETWSVSAGRGGSSQQVAVQAVFSLLAGESLRGVLEWLANRDTSPEERLSVGALSLLRSTPARHMNPFRKDLDDAGPLGVSEPAHKAIGLELIEAVRPRVLIADGNAEGERWISPWAYALSTAPESPVTVSEQIPPNYRLKDTELQSGPLRGMTVIGLPTLSQTSGRSLEMLLGFLSDRIDTLHRAAHPPE